MSLYVPELLEDFECPVCTEYMYPPIRLCAVGHSICNHCFARVRDCPVCRSPRTLARNLILEHMQKKLAFPCKNRSEGCRFVDVGSDITKHEPTCDYSPISCVLKISTSCNWHGAVMSLLDHCIRHHPNLVYTANTETIIYLDFIRTYRSNKNSSHIIIQHGDETFLCVWKVNCKTNVMKWCVFYVGVDRSPADFLFEIFIENHGVERGILTIEGECKNFKKERKVFAKNTCKYADYKMVRKFCHGKHLKYRVNIRRNWSNEN